MFGGIPQRAVWRMLPILWPRLLGGTRYSASSPWWKSSNVLVAAGGENRHARCVVLKFSTWRWDNEHTNSKRWCGWRFGIYCSRLAIRSTRSSTGCWPSTGCPDGCRRPRHDCALETTIQYTYNKGVKSAFCFLLRLLQSSELFAEAASPSPLAPL